MRLATLSTELEMWDCDLRHYVTVPAGTTVQVTEYSLKRWVQLGAPGGLDMWNGERGEYVSVPIETMAHVTEPNEKWVEVRAPGGLTLSFPADYYRCARFDFLDEGSPDATSET